MSRITEIKSQRNGKRVNVYLDDKFGFGIDLENFIKLGLKINQELSDERVIEIVKKAEFQKTLDKLLRFATLRPRSGKEITDYFRRKKVHASIHEGLIAKLKRLDLIDDTAFTRWWVEQRLAFKPKGKKALESELTQKGVDKDIIRSALDGLDINEDKIASELLKKNRYKWERCNSSRKRQKAQSFLARKGFSWEVIDRVAGKVVK